MTQKKTESVEGVAKSAAIPADERRKLNTPNMEVQVSMSNDGKWYIHKTIITSIKPVAYIKKVLDGSQ